MDLSKIGKCELCVLAKQVRAKYIEIGEKAKTDGTWDQELMDEYERCACSLEEIRDTLHQCESRHYAPTKTVADLFTDIYQFQKKEMADAFVESHRKTIMQGMRLIGVFDKTPGENSDPP